MSVVRRHCRLVASLASFALVVSSAPGAFAQDFDQYGEIILPTQPNPGVYTAKPGPWFRGKSPGKAEESRGGIWNDDKIGWYMERHASMGEQWDVYACISPLGLALKPPSTPSFSGPALPGEATYVPFGDETGAGAGTGGSGGAGGGSGASGGAGGSGGAGDPGGGGTPGTGGNGGTLMGGGAVTGDTTTQGAERG